LGGGGGRNNGQKISGLLVELRKKPGSPFPLHRTVAATTAYKKKKIGQQHPEERKFHTLKGENQGRGKEQGL